MVATAEKKFRSQLLSHWVQGLQIRRKTAIVGEIQWIRPVDFVEKFVSKFAFSALLGSVGRRLPKRDHNRPHHLPSLARRRLSRLRVTSSPPPPCDDVPLVHVPAGRQGVCMHPCLLLPCISISDSLRCSALVRG
jgi:hypothetical protein